MHVLSKNDRVNSFLRSCMYNGLSLQTAFIIAYMFFAPVFGYFGDRYNRILLLVVGISFWSGK